MDENDICYYKDHKMLYTHYCHTCNLRLCSKCVNIHICNPNYFSHELVKINLNSEKWKKKIAEIEKDKNVINIIKREENTLNNFNGFSDKLNKLNNEFINALKEYIKDFSKFEEAKNTLENKLKNKEKINYKVANENISYIYNKVRKERKTINDFLNSVEILLKNKKLNIPPKRYEQLIPCSQINKFVINPINNKNNFRDIKLNNSNSFFCNKKIEKKEIIEKKNKEEIMKGTNNINNISNNYNSTISLSLHKHHIHNKKEENNMINKKSRRERKKKECSFCDDCQKNSNESPQNKKRKFDNISQEMFKKKFNNITKLNEQQIGFFSKINNENTNEINLNMFNLRMDEDNTLSFILLENIQKNVSLTRFKSNDIIYDKSFLHSEKFPFLGSRLININNSAFIIGGRNYWEMDERGNTFVFFVNRKNKNQIQCIRLKDTRYNHQLHSLIYSKLYNIIFVLSGRIQTACEYGILNEEKTEIKEWKELTPIRNPRQNAICFLLNEKYIFLIGGQDINDLNYDIFDISSIFNTNNPRIWKTYNFNTNQFNKYFLNAQNLGIINNENKIFILGGNRYEFNGAINFKLYFTNDDVNNSENFKRIKNIELMENKTLNEYDGFLYFLGQQSFMKFDDCFHNINGQGKYIIFPKNIFV